MHTRFLVLVGSFSLALVACNKDKPTEANATSSATVTASSATVTASAKPAPKPFKDPSEDSSIASADVLPTGKPVPAKTLALYDWPIPKSVPADALWTAPDAEKDGYTLTNIMKGKEGWASFVVFDCRYDGVRKMAGKPLSDTNVFGYCFVTMPDTFKGYPSFAKEGSDPFRAVRAGNVVVFGSVWERKDKWKRDKLDELMGAVDWATVATW